MIQIGCILLVLAVLTALCPRLPQRLPQRWIRPLMWGAFILYCAGNLYFTLLSRKAGSQSQVDLIPFRSYLRLFAPPEEADASATGFAAWFLAGTPPIVGIVLNVFLYYPLGYLVPQLFPRLKPWQVIAIGCLCSVATEATQYLFQMGWCEMDDVIHNTLGAALGVGVYRLQSRRPPKP